MSRNLKKLLFATYQWPLSWFVGFALMIPVTALSMSWMDWDWLLPPGRIIVALGFCLLSASHFGNIPEIRSDPPRRIERIVRKGSVVVWFVAMIVGFSFFTDDVALAKKAGKPKSNPAAETDHP